MTSTYLPRRSVAFAPTEVFARHWQDEVKTQAAKFNRPSWAVDEELSSDVSPVVATSDKQQPPAVAPLVSHAEPSTDFTGLLILGGLFFVGLGVGIFVARWLAK